MNNTATFKIKADHKAIIEIALPIPSYYKSERPVSYVKVHSEKEITRVSLGGYCPRIEFDDFFGFTPVGYVPITKEEFIAAYEDCEKSLRDRTFAPSKNIKRDEITSINRNQLPGIPGIAETDSRISSQESP